MFGRAARINFIQINAGDSVQPQVSGSFGINRVDRDAQEATFHFPVGDQIFGDALDEIYRHGETVSLVRAGFSSDGCVYAYELAAKINQSASRVAGVDRRVGLDEVFDAN